MSVLSIDGAEQCVVSAAIAEDCATRIFTAEDGRQPVYVVDLRTAGAASPAQRITALAAETSSSFSATAANQKRTATAANASEPYDSQRFGAVADNKANDAPALQSMLDAAAAASDFNSSTVVHLNGARSKFRVDSGLTFDPQRVVFDGNGNTLDFANKTSGAFSGVKLSTSGENLTRTFLRHSVRGMRNVAIEMPSYTVNPDSVGIELVDETDDGKGNYRAGGIPLSNVSVIGGGVALKFGNGAWGSTITNFTAGHDLGNLGGVGVYAPAPLVDGQEAPKFIGGLISNRTKAFAFGVGSVKVIGMSIDGCATIAQLEGNGHLTFVGGYSEFTDGDDAHYKFMADDKNAIIEISDWEFSVRPDLLATRTKALIRNSGTVILRNLTFRGGNAPWYRANSGFLVEGEGSVHASGLVYKNFSWAPLPHKNTQWLPYPDVDSARWEAAFALSSTGGGAKPARAKNISDGKSRRDAIDFSLRKNTDSTGESVAFFTRSGMTPGKRVSVVGSFFSNNLTDSSASFEATIAQQARDGSTLVSRHTTVARADTTNWTTFGIDVGTLAAGTESVSVMLRLRAKGNVVRDTHVYVSPLGIGYADGE